MNLLSTSSERGSRFLSRNVLGAISLGRLVELSINIISENGSLLMERSWRCSVLRATVNLDLLNPWHWNGHKMCFSFWSLGCFALSNVLCTTGLALLLAWTWPLTQLTLIIPKWGISLNGLLQEFLMGGQVFLEGVEVWLLKRIPHELNNVFSSVNYQWASPLTPHIS